MITGYTAISDQLCGVRTADRFSGGRRVLAFTIVLRDSGFSTFGGRSSA